MDIFIQLRSLNTNTETLNIEYIHISNMCIYIYFTSKVQILVFEGQTSNKNAQELAASALLINNSLLVSLSKSSTRILPLSFSIKVIKPLYIIQPRAIVDILYWRLMVITGASASRVLFTRRAAFPAAGEAARRIPRAGP